MCPANVTTYHINDGSAPGAVRVMGPDERVVNSCPADPVPSAESGSPIGSPSQQPGLEGYLIRLICALAEQTEAINRLASSNEALVQAMANNEGMDEELSPHQYLNGNPVR